MDITSCTKEEGPRCIYCGEPLDLEGECPNACTLDPNHGLVEELDLIDDDFIDQRF
jgi:hypothetical protein